MGSKERDIDISIITVTYKSWDTLRDLLNSIQQSICKDLNIEIIIVDNYAQDSEYLSVLKEFPNAIYIKNPKNSGFASGCNIGAKKAKGAYYLFLNPDTIATKEAVSKMYAYLKHHDNCGIVSCKQKKMDGTFEKIKRYFPRLSTIFGFFRVVNNNALERNTKETENFLYPEWVSGAVVFMSSSWFSKVNGWNEDYWMYYEDIELSKNIRNLGGEVVLLKNCFIIHKHGVSSRINIKTTAITKTEVLISKHVYLHNNFSRFYRFFLQSIVLFYNVFSKLIIAIVSLPLCFIPKARLQILLLLNIANYYISALQNGTWLSKRSVNYGKK
ncbi:glycosyltransferase family 2 protein [Polaribacter sp. WD7]|uniref:glycosyltransferase family 2 protein n=1 Tax=Polaribacter sp. WD7 TaxID=2269061 RepID=UPI000DF21D47|nr:glycosyltransferase family 2 protein [Polaribacter sp. WD7]RCS27351.1 glycosyltransferase family 2 protein [Polaribacter sp. WD7]